MKFPKIGRPFHFLSTTLLIAASSMAMPAIAVGNHHKKILVPVQTVTVQTTQVQAAAPVAYYQIQAAAAPVAAAPMAYYQVHAAPVAAAPMAYYQMQPAAAAPVKVAAAPVAAAPVSPTQITYNGSIYTLSSASKAAAASPSVAASPSGDDGLSEDDRKKILDRLTEFVTLYKKSIPDTTILRPTIRSKASSLYAEVTSKDPESTEGNKAIESLVARSMGETPTTSDPVTPNTTTTQPVQIPVSAAPLPMQLFLPVKVKHHGGFYYR